MSLLSSRLTLLEISRSVILFTQLLMVMIIICFAPSVHKLLSIGDRSHAKSNGTDQPETEINCLTQ